MSQKLTFEILRDNFLISPEAVQDYAVAAMEYLAGKRIEDGFFSSLELPDVPSNVALVTLTGVLTKSDICGGQGSRTLSNQIADAASDPNISAIIVYSENCPGGQVDGTKALADAVIAAKAIKPVIGAVSGMSCSASVWVQSGCSEVYATSPTDQIGCIGVFGRMKNPAKAKNDGDYIEVYSDLSPDKNGESRSVEVMKELYLNPVAAMFQADVKAGRDGKLKLNKEDVLSGKTYLANPAKEYGLIDGILPFPQIVSRALSLSQQQNKNKMSTTKILVAGAAAFASVLTAAAAESFAVVDDIGFGLTEDQLNKLESHLSSQATSLTAANNRIAELTAAATASQTNVANLTAEVARLKTGNAGVFTAPVITGEDAPPGGQGSKFLTSYDQMVIELKQK